MASESTREKTLIETMVGPLTVAGDHDFIHRIEFGGQGAVSDIAQKPASPALRNAAAQLERYFSGELFSFDLPIMMSGTDFQKQVWRIMQTIEYGRVMTYGDIARQLGSVRLARAVGQAANRNPIPIVVPCHRVVGVNGAMVGYASGVHVKETLLDLEKRFGDARQ